MGKIHVRRQAAREQHGTAEHEKPDGKEVARLHVRHGETDDRDQKYDGERARTEDQTRKQCRIAQVLLRKLRNQNGAAV